MARAAVRVSYVPRGEGEGGASRSGVDLTLNQDGRP